MFKVNFRASRGSLCTFIDHRVTLLPAVEPPFGEAYFRNAQVVLLHTFLPPLINVFLLVPAGSGTVTNCEHWLKLSASSLSQSMAWPHVG